MRKVHIDRNGQIIGFDDNPNIIDVFKTIEIDVSNINSFVVAKVDLISEVLVEGASDMEIHEYRSKEVALFREYQYLSNENYKLLSLDNLEGINRKSVFSNDGICRKKEYYKNGVLIWSISTRYWDDLNAEYLNGLVKVVRLYSTNGNVFDSWLKYIELSDFQKLEIVKNRLISV